VRGYRRGDGDAVGGATLDDAIDDATARLQAYATAPPAARPPGQRVHATLDPPLSLEVRAEYLYGMDPARIGEFVPCRVFAVSSYPGEAPTFQLRLPDGAVFSYLPPTALVDRDATAWGQNAPDLDLRRPGLRRLPGRARDRHHLRRARRRRPRVPEAPRPGSPAAIARRSSGGPATWSSTSSSSPPGSVALLPHHKLKFGAAHGPGFAPYRKVRKLWRVGDGG
jgi:hypothetical protein